MSIAAIFIGVLVSIILIVRFKITRLETHKFTYSLLLFSFPLYYLTFAIYGLDFKAAPLEVLVGSLFFVIAILSLKFNTFYKFSFLSIGYLLHGAYDIGHDLLFVNGGTPFWWPEFCGSIDIVLGLYLLNLAFNSRIKNN